MLFALFLSHMLPHAILSMYQLILTLERCSSWGGALRCFPATLESLILTSILEYPIVQKWYSTSRSCQLLLITDRSWHKGRSWSLRESCRLNNGYLTSENRVIVVIQLINFEIVIKLRLNPCMCLKVFFGLRLGPTTREVLLPGTYSEKSNIYSGCKDGIKQQYSEL